MKSSYATLGSARGDLRPAVVPVLAPLTSTRLLDQLRERIRLLYYSRRTEQAYVPWCRAFIRFHGLRHPADMGKAEVEAFLIHLAADKGLAVSTHRQALSALLFLYGKVLEQQLPWMSEIGALCRGDGAALKAMAPADLQQPIPFSFGSRCHRQDDSIPQRRSLR